MLPLRLSIFPIRQNYQIPLLLAGLIVELNFPPLDKQKPFRLDYTLIHIEDGLIAIRKY